VSTAEERLRGFLATVTSVSATGRTAFVTEDTVPLIRDLAAVLDDLKATRSERDETRRRLEAVHDLVKEAPVGEIAGYMQKLSRAVRGIS